MLNCILESKNSSVIDIIFETDELTDPLSKEIYSIISKYQKANFIDRTKEFNISFKQSMFTCTGISNIIKSLESSDLIRSLTILGSSKPFDESVPIQIEKSLKVNKTIQRFEFGNFATEKKTLLRLLKVLGNQKQIKEFVLSDFEITPNQLKELLNNENSSFIELNFQNCSVCLTFYLTHLVK